MKRQQAILLVLVIAFCQSPIPSTSQEVKTGPTSVRPSDVASGIFRLNTLHNPLGNGGWKIVRAKSKQKETGFGDESEAKILFEAGKDDPNAEKWEMYFLVFDYKQFNEIAKTKITAPVFIGWPVEMWGAHKGIARDYIESGRVKYRYSSSGKKYFFAEGNFQDVEPENYVSQLSGGWSDFLQPVYAAESGKKWCLMNTYDNAGVTAGKVQMSAHDGKDLMAMLIEMLDNPIFVSGEWDDPKKWFPEFSVKSESDGTKALSYVYEGEEYPIKNHIGQPKYREEQFLRIFNPNFDKNSKIDEEELQFIARWVMWSQSPRMLHAQEEACKSIVTKLFKKGFSDYSAKETVSAKDWATAYVLLHWRDSGAFIESVKKMLSQPDPYGAFLKLKSVYTENKNPDWFTANVEIAQRYTLWQRVTAVEKLFNENPDLEGTLSSLKFDPKSGALSKPSKQ
jgi:hypothetical protein